MLDWEIATLGDPLADFAYALNAWAEPGDPATARADAPTALPGFSTRDDLLGLYAARTGADLWHLAYYRSFNSLKTACIIHGVYARYRRGQKSTDGVDMDALHDRIEASIDIAEHTCRRHLAVTSEPATGTCRVGELTRHEDLAGRPPAVSARPCPPDGRGE